MNTKEQYQAAKSALMRLHARAVSATTSIQRLDEAHEDYNIVSKTLAQIEAPSVSGEVVDIIRWVYWDERNNQMHTTPSGRTYIMAREPKQTDCVSASANWKRPMSKRKIKIEVVE